MLRTLTDRLSLSLLGVLLLTLSPACSSGGEDDGPPMRLEEVHLSLLTREDLRQVLLQDPTSRVEFAHIAPGGRQYLMDGTVLPSLRLSPPARVEFELPELPPEARLRFAIGVDKEGHEQGESGRVEFSVTPEGGQPFRCERAFGSEVADAERAWVRAEIELKGARKLSLESRALEGDAAGLPLGIALLEVMTEHEVPRGRASVERPNVILILVDTLRADRLGAYGYPRPTSPRLDAFAKSGTLFERAYSASSWTFPSTASVLTGLTPPEHGLESHQACFLAQELETVAEAFQRAGWSTAAWAVNPLIRAERDFDQGFESFEESMWTPTDEIVDQVLPWLDEHGQWRFFLYLHLGDPHEFRPSEPFRETWVPKFENEGTHKEYRRLNESYRLAREHDAERLREVTRQFSELYDATVAEMDAAIGRLLDELAARGLDENTVIAFTSDHGEAFLEHDMCMHGGQLYDEFVHIPLIVAGPRVAEGQRVVDPVENRFLAGSLLRHAGVDPPGNLDGVDLFDPRAVEARSREPIFLNTRQGFWKDGDGPGGLQVGEVASMRAGDRMYLWAPNSPEERLLEKLYDLSKDPEAQDNLAGESSAEREAELDALRRAVVAWKERAGEIRPTVFGGGEELEDLMRAMGYLGAEDEDDGN